METAGQRRRPKEWWPACLFGAPYAQGHLGFCSGDRVRSRLRGVIEPLPLGVFLRVGRRSVVLVASRGLRLWYDVGGVGG